MNDILAIELLSAFSEDVATRLQTIIGYKK